MKNIQVLMKGTLNSVFSIRILIQELVRLEGKDEESNEESSQFLNQNVYNGSLAITSNRLYLFVEYRLKWFFYERNDGVWPCDRYRERDIS